MSSPIPSKLDGQQVLQYAFDESSGELRVKASLTSTIIPPPGLEVSISAVDDNIAIRNSNNTDELLINSDGSINVNATVVQRTANTIGNAWPVKPTDGSNSQGYTVSSEAKVSVTQPLVAGTNNIGKVSIQDSSGTAFSASNPLFVTFSDTVGTSVDNYNTASAIAAAATSNHDYSITSAKTFYSKQIYASASGKLKIEVQFETGSGTGVFNSFFVGFNSTANPNIIVPIPTSKTQVTGAKIRVIRTNDDTAAQDVYSTISGTEQ